MAEQRIWVFSEKTDLLAELIAGARQLGGSEVTAAVIGPRADAERTASGADRIIWLGEAGPGRLKNTISRMAASRAAKRNWGL